MPKQGVWQGGWEQYVQTAKNQNGLEGSSSAFGTLSGGNGIDAFHVLFGGPGKWLGLDPMVGNMGVHLAHTELSQDPEGEAIFNSMSDDELLAFEKMNGAERRSFINNRKEELGKSNALTAQQQEKQAREKQYQEWRQGAMTRLDDFSKKMGMSVDELIASGDAGMASNRNQAASQAGQRGVGLSGGVSNMNSQRAVADAALKYQSGRQQLGLQATQGLMQGLNQEYLNEEDRRRYEQGIDLQLQQARNAAYMQKYKDAQQQRAGLLGMVGTAIGGIFGGAQGAQAGGALGQGVGNMSYSQDNRFMAPGYYYPSGGGAGYGLGGGSANSGWGGWKPSGNQQ